MTIDDIDACAQSLASRASGGCGWYADTLLGADLDTAASRAVCRPPPPPPLGAGARRARPAPAALELPQCTSLPEYAFADETQLHSCRGGCFPELD